MYHISDYKKYKRCSRLFLLSKNEIELIRSRSFVRLDESITDLASKKLKVNQKNCFIGESNDAPELALKAMNHKRWLIKARFEYDCLRVKVPFLKRRGKVWDVYFLYLGLYPHKDDISFYASVIWVLENNNIPLGKLRMIHLNADYIRQDSLDIEQLFVISDCFYNEKNNPSNKIIDEIKKYKVDFHETLNEMNQLKSDDLPNPIRTTKCSARQKCKFYDTCFPEETDCPDNSILTLIGSRDRYEIKNRGIQYLRECDFSLIEGTRMQYAQIRADQQGGLFCDKLALHSWMKQIKYPINFLDFEWECFAIPPYQNMKPYDVLPFEYSIHILEEDGTLKHKVFLDVHDSREKLAESLVENISSCGSVVAYNAKGAEMIRIQELANQFPQYREQLNSMNQRMIDLQDPFVNGFVYDVRMRGSWTLKQIMSLMDEPGYRDLDIRNGMDAVFRWRQLDRQIEFSDNKKIIEELKKYCGMDTFSMAIIYQWLRDLVNEKN